MGLLEGKKGIIFGIANDKSIAWAVAQSLKKEGAEIALSYSIEKLASRVAPLADSIGIDTTLMCDVTSDEDIDKTFKVLEDKWGKIDFIVHSVAYANREDLKGQFIDTSRAGFLLALEISAFSLVAITKRAQPIMNKGGRIVAMSYYGAEKVIKNYNVMGVAKSALESSVRYLAEDVGRHGVRVNAISAGPIKTLAASAITGFKDILDIVDEKAPLRRNITQHDVAGSSLYLISDLSGGVTGEVIYVDSGYNIIGV